MAFCPNCGCELAEGVKFCGNCGARQLPPETPAEPVVPATETPANIYEETPAVEEPAAEEPVVIEPPAAAEEPVSFGQPAAYQQPAAEENYYGYSSPRDVRGVDDAAEKKKISPLPFIIGGAALLVVLVIVLVLVISGGKSNKNSSSKAVAETVQTTDKSKAGDFSMVGGKTKVNENDAATPIKSKEAITAEDEDGIDIAGVYNATSCMIDGEEYPCDGEYVKLNSDGTGTVMFMDTEYDIDWVLSGSDFSFTDSDGDEFTGTYTDGVLEGNYAGIDYVFDINGEPTAPAAAESDPSAVAAFWDGDWYGWWGVYDCTGEYTDAEGMWWDCCARIEAREDLTGSICLWDEDTSDESPLMLAEISIMELDDLASGVAFSTSGQFLGMDLSDSGCALTNDSDFDHAIDILGEYEDDEGSFSYVFFMLPWGADWEEVEETDETLMPYYYDWYLEQLEAGVTNAPGEIG